MPAETPWQEVRCNNCRSLLFKAAPETKGAVEIPCKKCRRLAQIVLPLKLWPQGTPARGVIAAPTG